MDDKKNFYDSISSDYDSDFLNLYANAHHFAIKQIQLHLDKIGCMLDLCVGTGNFLLLLLNVFDIQQFTGIDISKKMLTQAKNKIPIKWTAIADDVRNICKYIPLQSQDLIVAHFSYDFISPAELLPICYRLLRPGGLISLASTTKQKYDEIFYQQINKHKTLSKLLDIHAKIANATIIDSHQAHLSLVKNNGFQIMEGAQFTDAIHLKNAKELWDLLYHSGWMASYFSQCSSLKMHLLKLAAYCLKLPFMNIYPLHFNNDCSIILARKLE